ncbi:hypothetical protein PsorP6_006028 [Peronosclerospora sorghi]|uniref:Uncharacterized protein n=1 Tax=Peronosclerospora sorghi TaxID=230839 RepID=A0ACC0W885_9STRA|nr:hypothetical protein PsorP6_006028 [Peronosclerospora sorghi]
MVKTLDASENRNPVTISIPFMFMFNNYLAMSSAVEIVQGNTVVSRSLNIIQTLFLVPRIF